MNRSRSLRGTADLWLLTVTLIATRVVFRSHYLYDIDSVNFALGMRRFDPTAHQPHPPGYFLYILLGRVVDTFFHNANAALVAISIAASCGALLMIYLLANNWFGRSAAVFAGLIFVFSPLVWFHGTVALTYAVEAFFSSVIGYLCWRVCCGAGAFIVPAAVALGLAAGFRPSSLLFLGPLMMFALVFAPGRFRRGLFLAGVAGFGVTVTAWFLPMVRESGGWDAYWSALHSLWNNAPGRQTTFDSAPAVSFARLVSIGGIFLLCFGFAAVLVFRRKSGQPGIGLRRKAFVWIWILPGLLFFALVFLRFVNSGYLLVISPPLFVLLGRSAAGWYANSRLGQRAKAGVVFAFATANSLIFLFAPVYCSYGAVRRFETELRDVVRLLPQIASPGDTMIVGFDSHFLGYRHAGYYLPQWYTVQYPEVRLDSEIRVFAMEHGDTRLADRLPLQRFRSFVFFPLPSGDSEYRDYMAMVRARFPAGALRSVTAGGRQFVLGSVTDLPLLFPVSAKDAPVAGR